MRILHLGEDSFTLSADVAVELKQLEKLLDVYKRVIHAYEGYGGPAAARILSTVKGDQIKIEKAFPDLAYSNLAILVRFFQGFLKANHRVLICPLSEEVVDTLSAHFPIEQANNHQLGFGPDEIGNDQADQLQLNRA